MPLLELVGICVCLRTASVEWNVTGKYGPHGELFFFLVQEELAIAPNIINPDSRTPFFSADVLKKCALIALHVTAKEGRGGESGCHVLGMGDSWKFGCPKSPMWESEGEAWSEDTSVSSCDPREDNECNDALHVIGLYGPGDKVSFFLKDWELARVAVSCHMALDMLCQEMHEA